MLLRLIRHHRLSPICFSSTNSPRRSISVLFFGSDIFSKSCLKALRNDYLKEKGNIVTELGVVGLREKDSRTLPVKDFAEKNNIPFSTWPEFPHVESGFDIGVVVSFGKLIPKSVIESFKYGMINVHGSLLPRWRGASPLAHAIMENDKVTGITIMQIAPRRFDHGKILEMSEAVTIHPQWTAEDLGIALEDVASSCLLKCLSDIEHYLANLKPQSKDGVTNAPKITLEHTKIRWNSQTAEQIYRRFLAFGFKKEYFLRTSFKDKQVKFQKFMLPDNKQLSRLPLTAEPGDVFFDKETKTLFVKCKHGYLGILKLIYGKPITSQDFYNGSMQARMKKGEKINFE